MHKKISPCGEIFLFFIFRHHLGNAVVIVGQNGVDPHLQEGTGLFGIIRPKNIADDAVGVGFINHFLIKIRLK